MEESAFNPDLQNVKAEYRIVAALEKIAQVFRILLWEESKKTCLSLSPIQIQILVFILFQPAKRSTTTSLAREFNLTKATVSDSVKVLEQKRLVSRNYVGIDNRSFTLTLTSSGQKIAKSSSLFANVLQMHVHSLKRSHQSNLLDSLLQIIHLLDNNGVISSQRMCKTCRFFEIGKTTHYCSLIRQDLRPSDLRLDCSEHESKSIVSF